MSENPFALDEIPRRVMPLIFLVDTSGSMEGSKIASLNTAVREALNDVGEISRNNSDAQIKVAVLEFNSSVNWMYPQPIVAEQFQWQDLNAGGMTSLGEALDGLNSKLSKSNGFMAEPSGSRAPAIILLSDGEPTDDYTHALDKIKGNPWYKVAVKVAIAVGDDANKSVLADFTGNIESVITVHNVDQLKRIIHTVSVTASQVASQGTSGVSSSSAPSVPVDVNDQAVNTINNTISSDPTLNGVDVGGSSTNSGTDDWGGNW